MTMISASQSTAIDPFEELIADLECEFGTGAGAALAAHFVDAEAADFYWEARSNERPLGAYESLEEEREGSLERTAVSGFFGGRWYAAICLVGPNGAAVELLHLERFGTRLEAETAAWVMQ